MPKLSRTSHDNYAINFHDFNLYLGGGNENNEKMTTIAASISLIQHSDYIIGPRSLGVFKVLSINIDAMYLNLVVKELFSLAKNETEIQQNKTSNNGIKIPALSSNYFHNLFRCTELVIRCIGGTRIQNKTVKYRSTKSGEFHKSCVFDLEEQVTLTTDSYSSSVITIHYHRSPAQIHYR
ncbi:hypothetical protein AGLY_005020 [Aphis glycines]|uniref:Uncharacterized protein n=1 Tax=Aphis glycines TaxID=307491 RepID=A0A6G0TVJ7_APHGL|nr:hypothetical protein AGLY_005020 [Aphis glycines]